MIKLKEFHRVNLNACIHLYVDFFAKKHDLCFEYWVADQIGGVACFGDEYFVDFLVIRLDLEENVPANVFFKWFDSTVDSSLKGEPIINYKTFLKLNQK